MQTFTDTLASIHLGRPRRHQGLVVFPLFGPPADAEGSPAYRLLDEALTAGEVEIDEVSEGGVVPELRLLNRGKTPVLLLDGEELVGAKQNRVLNLTILAPPGETRLPVSCVEAGRWHHDTQGFRAAGRTQFAEARAAKVAQVCESRRAAGGMRADQGEVWSQIADKSARMGVHSRTQAMADLFDDYQDRLEDYVEALGAEPGQTGALFALGSRITGLDLFDHPDTLARSLPKLVRSHALDAIEQQQRGGPEDKGFPDAWGFLERLAQCEAAAFPSPGLGQDLRLEGEGVRGAALSWQGRLVHLVAFAYGVGRGGRGAGRRHGYHARRIIR